MATTKQRTTARRNLTKGRSAKRSPKQRVAARRNLGKARAARSSRGRTASKR